MSGMMGSVRDYTQGHPMSVAVGLIVALPGTYFYITGKSITCAAGLCADAPMSLHPPMANLPRALSTHSSQHPLDLRVSLPISKWIDMSAPTPIVGIIHDTSNGLIWFMNAAGERLGIDVQRIQGVVEDRWASHFPVSRLVSVAITTSLPAMFLVYIRRHPTSWASRHETKIANALHIFALVTVANKSISVQDLLVTALLMVSFEALQRTWNHDSGELPPAFETLLSQTHSVVAKSYQTVEPCKSIDKGAQVDDESTIMTAGSKDEEILRLHQSLTKLKTTQKAKEHDLKRVGIDLKNARDTLNETFAEYSSLRDEMKTMKQTLGRDHQAVVYRKDIELFALRKANEQKEIYIKDRDAKVDTIRQQQKATLELKDAQIRNLKERISFLERQQSPRLDGDCKVDSATGGDSQAALQVKLLRVKGRNSIELEVGSEEKELEIAKLKQELSKAVDAGEAHAKSQDELRRAWDATFEAQSALNDEREQHAQTKNKLQEAAIRLDEEAKRANLKNSLTALPTIEEQDKKELEAMFNAAQQDNLRLYEEVEALDKRVREANARNFSSEQEAEALSEQLRLEKAINEDMETARPSLVHRVHFQRMEGQLKESQDALDAKEEDIEQLEKKVAEIENKASEHAKEKEAATAKEKTLQTENEKLKQAITALEATKQQLMLDHERLAHQRARQRTTSAEHTSARSSGATLITEFITSHAITSSEPLSARPVSIAASSSIQGTPERHLRSESTPNRLSLITNDLPPPELRSTKRKSLTLKGLIRKIGRKDADVDEMPKTPVKEAVSEQKPRMALMPKDENASMRPKTAAAAPVKKVAVTRKTPEQRPKTAKTPRYYAGKEEARPQTAAPELDGLDKQRPKSRGWNASRKIVRKSVILS